MPESSAVTTAYPIPFSLSIPHWLKIHRASPISHMSRRRDNETYVTKEDWPRVTELIDWLIEKNRAGCKMVDSVQRLTDMKNFVHGQHEPWHCRAGHNSLIIRVDGTVAPCFPMYAATRDGGSVGDHHFEQQQLGEMKKSCELNCLSTLNQVLALCYDDAGVIRYFVNQAKRGFQGVTGSVE
jgi:MoaA/NifB/PqqE/SkfB family radical SAM enzyme